MHWKSVTLIAVTQVTAVLLINSAALALPWHTTTYHDDITEAEFKTFSGLTSYPILATVTQNPSLITEVCCESGIHDDCYRAVAEKGFLFSYADKIRLPPVGKTYCGGLIDQVFHDQIKTHEDWHKAYIDALLTSTYAKLELWSKDYFSGCFSTAAAAEEAGGKDLTAALKTANVAFLKDLSKQNDPALGHPGGSEIKVIGGVATWRAAHDVNWGQKAVDYATNIKIEFSKTPGDCPCIPEPSSALLVLVGMTTVGLGRVRRRRVAFAGAGDGHKVPGTTGTTALVV